MQDLLCPRHLVRTVHDLYFEPKYEEFRPRTIWSLSNAFTSAFKELEPIPYRAIDKQGDLVDSMLSATRNMAAAQRFFRNTLSVAGQAPAQVTIDGHDSYPRAVRETLGPEVEHRDNAYLNRRIEQDHRGIKQRYYPMLGFGAYHSAQRFCSAFDEVRQYFRPRRKRKQFVSLARQRQQLLARVHVLQPSFLAT